MISERVRGCLSSLATEVEDWLSGRPPNLNDLLPLEQVGHRHTSDLQSRSKDRPWPVFGMHSQAVQQNSYDPKCQIR